MALVAKHGNTKKLRTIYVLIIVLAGCVGLVSTRIAPVIVTEQLDRRSDNVRQLQDLQKQVDTLQQVEREVTK